MPNCKKYIKNKKTRPFTKMAERKDLLPNVVMPKRFAAECCNGGKR